MGPGLALSITASSISIDADFTNVAPGYPIAFTALNSGSIAQSVWDFGGGPEETNQPFVSHIWNTPGVYSVRLTGYNQNNPAGVKATLAVVVSDLVYYVDSASANPAFPYQSWATAARTIQEAIGVSAVPGRLVLVTNGVYRTASVNTNGTNRVALTGAVRVRSVNGPTVTTIDGLDTVRGAYVGNHSVLDGFTVRRGAALDIWPPGGPGGGVWCETLGLVTNCVLTHNSAGIGGGAYGGTLYHCQLIGNSSQSYAGGAYGAILYNCLLSGNSANNYGGLGGGAGASTLYTCVLTANSASGNFGAGGGTSGCVLYNCVLYANTAQSGGGASVSTLYNCTVHNHQP